MCHFFKSTTFERNKIDLPSTCIFNTLKIFKFHGILTSGKEEKRRLSLLENVFLDIGNNFWYLMNAINCFGLKWSTKQLRKHERNINSNNNDDGQFSRFVCVTELIECRKAYSFLHHIYHSLTMFSVSKAYVSSRQCSFALQMPCTLKM